MLAYLPQLDIVVRSNGKSSHVSGTSMNLFQVAT